MSVNAYLRASLSKQEMSPETQWAQIKQYCELKGLGEPKRWEDAATSSEIELSKRRAGGLMTIDLQPGDHVVIAALDRAFRTARDCLNTIEVWKNMRVNLHITNFMGGAIDLNSPLGMFFLQVLVAFAELERGMIRERTRKGLETRRKAGMATGFAPIGYRLKPIMARGRDGKLIKKHLLELDRATIVQMAEVQQMLNEGMKATEIASHMRSKHRRYRGGKADARWMDWTADAVNRAHVSFQNLVAEGKIHVDSDGCLIDEPQAG